MLFEDENGSPITGLEQQHMRTDLNLFWIVILMKIIKLILIACVSMVDVTPFLYLPGWSKVSRSTLVDCLISTLYTFF